MVEHVQISTVCAKIALRAVVNAGMRKLRAREFLVFLHILDATSIFAHSNLAQLQPADSVLLVDAHVISLRIATDGSPRRIPPPAALCVSCTVLFALVLTALAVATSKMESPVAHVTTMQADVLAVAVPYVVSRVAIVKLCALKIRACVPPTVPLLQAFSHAPHWRPRLSESAHVVAASSNGALLLLAEFVFPMTPPWFTSEELIAVGLIPKTSSLASAFVKDT